MFVLMTIYSAFGLFHREISGVYLQTDYEIPASIVSYNSIHFARNTRPADDEVRIVNIYGNQCTIVFGDGQDMDFAQNVNMIDLRYDGKAVEMIKGRTNNFSLEYYETPIDQATPLSQSPWFVGRQAVVIIVFILITAGTVVYVWLGWKNEYPILDHPKIYTWVGIGNIVLCLAEVAILVFKLIFH